MDIGGVDKEAARDGRYAVDEGDATGRTAVGWSCCSGGLVGTEVGRIACSDMATGTWQAVNNTRTETNANKRFDVCIRRYYAA
jgi:hypothetical protein